MSLAENNGKGCTTHISISTLFPASRPGEKQHNITSHLWEVHVRALEEEFMRDTLLAFDINCGARLFENIRFDTNLFPDFSFSSNLHKHDLLPLYWSSVRWWSFKTEHSWSSRINEKSLQFCLVCLPMCMGLLLENKPKSCQPQQREVLLKACRHLKERKHLELDLSELCTKFWSMAWTCWFVHYSTFGLDSASLTEDIQLNPTFMDDLLYQQQL